MKKILCLIFAITVVVTTYAQTQQGIVKTRGRMTNTGILIPGTRLAGATVSVQNISPSLTGSNGTFSFSVQSAVFYLTNVQKQGYQLCDQDILRRGHRLSADTLIVAMETPDNITADRLAAERKIRRTLQRQLQDKEEEIEALKDEQKITIEAYNKQLQELYAKQGKNEDLISEMSERYSTIDFDAMDDFQRQVAFFIQNGDLMCADSLLNTKGSMEERSAELDRMDAALKADSEDLAKRQEAHDKSVVMKAKALEDFASDCYSHFEICKMQHKNDSAAYWLELRASKDTTNGSWQVECGSFILNYLADYDRAQFYMQRVVDIMSNNPDVSDEGRGSSLANLADVYLKSERYDDAKKLYQQSRELCAQNPLAFVAASVGLANCYEMTKEGSKALICLREADSVYQKCEEKGVLLSVRLYDQLGVLLFDNGQVDEGVQYIEKSIDILETEETIGQSAKLISIYEAASIFRRLDNYPKAEELYKRSLDLCLLIYDNKHPMLASVYNGLGSLYYDLSKYQEALEYLLKAKSIMSEDRMTDAYAQICSNIAGIYLISGNLQKSEQFEIEAFEIRKKLFGEDSPAMFDSYNDLGALYFEMSEYDKALGYIESAVALLKKEFGEKHPSLILSYTYIGAINMRNGKLDKVLETFLDVLELTEYYFGQEHSKTASAYANVGGAYLSLKKYDEAISMLQKALQIHVSIYGEKHADVAGDYNGLGQTYMAMGHNQDAIANFQKAIDIRKDVFGENSVKLKSLYGFMKQIYQSMGDREKVEMYDTLLSNIDG